MNVNYWGVVNGTKAFLPHLISSGDGHVVNVSSIWGIFAAPGQSAYNSAKFAVRGFTEALRQEMMLGGLSGKGHHGFIPAASRPRSRAMRRQPMVLISISWRNCSTISSPKGSPELAARKILKGVSKNKARVLVGPGAKAIDLVVRATGSGYQRLFAPITGRMMPKANNTA